MKRLLLALLCLGLLAVFISGCGKKAEEEPQDNAPSSQVQEDEADTSSLEDADEAEDSDSDSDTAGADDEAGDDEEGETSN